MTNDNIKVTADETAKSKFGITETTQSPADAQELAEKINSSGQGDAKVENGELKVRTILRD